MMCMRTLGDDFVWPVNTQVSAVVIAQQGAQPEATLHATICIGAGCFSQVAVILPWVYRMRVYLEAVCD